MDARLPDLRRPLPLLGWEHADLYPGVVVGRLLDAPCDLAALGGDARHLIVVPLHASDLTAALEGTVGVLARVVEAAEEERGRRVLLEGLARVRLDDVRVDGELWRARATALDERPGAIEPAEADGLCDRLLALSFDDPRTTEKLAALVAADRDRPERLIDRSTALLGLAKSEHRALSGEPDPRARLRRLTSILETRLVRQAVLSSLDAKVAGRLRRRFLREKLAELRAELGEPEPHRRWLLALEAELGALPLPEPVRILVEHQLEHLRDVAPTSSDSARVRAHLEWVASLPWDAPAVDRSPDRFERVMASLAHSHVGLTDVKARIAEFLAVRELGGGARGTVLLFHGPPGTGKSSLGKSVAEALGRPFVTIPVGAMLRERELVGSSHRLASGQPGAILAGLARAGAANAVVLLDEIDKLSLGGEGDASGALLQVLDTDQNGEFLDHYLGAPFDLSRCVFLATANEIEDLPDALLDRMETIEFASFTEREKMRIARMHLIPRALQQAGLTSADLKITPAALKEVVRSYTEEAGVRQLQRHLSKLARRAAIRILEQDRGLWVKKGDLSRLLGPRTPDEEIVRVRPEVGVATGLAWTSAGGSLLPLELLAMPGGGRVILTGSVGEVLRESVQTAISYVRSTLEEHGLEHDALDHLDLHLHFPSAATPKDGPSAGVAIASALTSVLTDRPVRHDVALSGELSLRGRVLPVGGIREKLLAAARNGLSEVVLPAGNAEEVLRLAPELRNQLTVHLVHDVDEVLELVLERATSRRRRGPRGVAKRRRDRRASGH